MTIPSHHFYQKKDILVIRKSLGIIRELRERSHDLFNECLLLLCDNKVKAIQHMASGNDKKQCTETHKEYQSLNPETAPRNYMHSRWEYSFNVCNVLPARRLLHHKENRCSSLTLFDL